MAIRLRCTAGTWDLAAGTHTLGRHRDCELRVNDPRLSRQHARFHVDGSQLTVEDLGSCNGTLVNGDRIATATPLRHGDIVITGPLAIEVVNDGRPVVPMRVDASRRRTASGEHAVEPADTEELEPVDLPAAPSINDSTSDDGYQPITDRRATADAPPPEQGSSRSNPFDSSTDGQKKPVAAPTVDADIPLEPATDHRQEVTGALTALRQERNSPPPKPKPTAPEPDLDADDVADEEQRNPSTGLLRPSHVARPETKALQPNTAAVRRRGRRLLPRRLAAGSLDLLQTGLIAGILGVPVFSAGYAWALRMTGARLVDGVPSFAAGSTVAPAGWMDLMGSVFTLHGLGAVPRTIASLQSGNSQAFLVVFVAATLAALALVLVPLFTLVAASMVHGAPFWHRRFGLVIRHRQTGHHLAALHSLWRWLLVLILGPTAPISLLLGSEPLHDLLGGSRVETRE